MKNRIIGWICVIWGTLIVVSGLFNLSLGKVPQNAYGAGQIVGFLIGAVMVFAGIRQLQKKQNV